MIQMRNSATNNYLKTKQNKTNVVTENSVAYLLYLQSVFGKIS